MERLCTRNEDGHSKCQLDNERREVEEMVVVRTFRRETQTFAVDSESRGLQAGPHASCCILQLI